MNWNYGKRSELSLITQYLKKIPRLFPDILPIYIYIINNLTKNSKNIKIIKTKE